MRKMTKHRVTIGVGLAALACGVAMGVGFAPDEPAQSAQPDPEMMTPAQVAEYAQQLGKPGPRHELLAKMAGKWDYTFTFYMVPGAPPSVSKGSSEQAMILGGRCLKSSSKMRLNLAPGVEIPMEGMGWMGYNRHTGQYQMTWMDSIDPYIMIQSGPASEDGSTITFDGLSYSDEGETPMRTVITLKDADHYTMEFWANPEDPDTRFKSAVIDYTRTP